MTFRMFTYAGGTFPVSLAEEYAVLYYKPGGASVEYFVDWKRGLNSMWVRERDANGKLLIYAVIRTVDCAVLAQRNNPAGRNYCESWGDAVQSGWEPVLDEGKRAWET